MKPKKRSSPTATLALHTKFVKSIKETFATLLKNKGLQPSINDLPRHCGLIPIRIPVPPLFEAAFGYRGGLRFVAFHYSPPKGYVVHSDGGDDLPVPNPNDWITFVHHPVMRTELEDYFTLFGRVGTRKVRTPEEFQELSNEQREVYCRSFHALVLDRQERQLYVTTWENLKILFQPCAEPEEEAHIQLPDGTLVSTGNENFADPVDPTMVQALWEWLNHQLATPAGQERLARWHVNHGHLDEAKTILQQIAQQFPERIRSAHFQHILAFLFEESHDYTAAVTALERSLNSVAWNRLTAYEHLRFSKLYLEVRRPEKALRHLLELQSRPDVPPHLVNQDWYILCARAYTALGKREKAVEMCHIGIDRCIREMGDNGDAGPIYVQLAEIAALQGDYETAALHCQHAVDLFVAEFEEGTELPVAVYRVGWWLPVKARLSNAARVFRMVEAHPSHREMAFGYLYLAMDRYEEAAASFERFYDGEKSAEAVWFLALSQLGLKRRSHATTLFAELGTLFPGDERGKVGTALLYAAEGANDVAFEYCQKAVQINPDSGEAHALLAYLYWCFADYAAAKTAARKATRQGFSPQNRLYSPPSEGNQYQFLLLNSSSSEELATLSA